MGRDKVVMFAHDGGDVTLSLRARPSWMWVLGDTITDALDGTLIFLPQTGGRALTLVPAGAALLLAAWLVGRKKVATRAVLPAVGTGLAFAGLHSLYAYGRWDRVTTISKPVEVYALSLVATLLLSGCGAFFFVNAGSRRQRWMAILLACWPALAPAVGLVCLLAVSNLLFFRPRLGVDLYNYAPALQPLITLGVLAVLFGLTFFALRRGIESRNSNDKEATVV
jgi:LPXTG-motif cell wall-anchored protein